MRTILLTNKNEVALDLKLVDLAQGNFALRRASQAVGYGWRRSYSPAPLPDAGLPARSLGTP